MPIDNSWIHFLKSLKDQKDYQIGENICRDMKDGSKFCMHKKAWSVFFATMNKKGWDETKVASNLEYTIDNQDVEAITPRVFVKKRKRKKKIKDLSFEELEYYHSLFHSQFEKLGDKACRLHFKIASEMINRGVSHIRRTLCDGVVELIHNFKIYDPSRVRDEVLRDDFRISIAWLKKLRSTQKPFTSPQFEGMDLRSQIIAIKKLARSIRREMIKRDWHPKELIKLPEKFNVEEIDPIFLSNLSDKGVEDLWTWLHKKWLDQEGPDRVSESFLNTNIFVQIERWKRYLIDESYIDKDLLDEKSRKSWMEYPSPLDKEPDILTLEQVLEIFRKVGIIKLDKIPTVYLCGGIVNKGSIEKGKDIDLLFKRHPDPEILIAFKKSLPNWLFKRIHSIWDPKGPDIGRSIPLYTLAFSIIPKEKMKKGFGERELGSMKVGRPFIHLKPKSGMEKHEFWDPKESWEKWGADHINNEIIIQEKLDGRSMQLHYDKANGILKIMTEDTLRDRAKEFPEICEEIKKLTVKNIILDGEMLEYEMTKFEGKNARAKREVGELIDREDTASITTGSIPEDERKKIVYVFYDVLHIDGEDINNKNTLERYNILKDIIPKNMKFLDVVRGEIARSIKDYYRFIEKYRRIKGSEGVVMKDSSSIYPLRYSGENRTGEWCLTGGNYLLTERGFQRVDSIKENDLIFSRDGRLHKILARKVRKILPEEKLFDIFSKGGFKVRLTGNHEVLTSEGWLEAKDINFSNNFFPELQIPIEEAPSILELEWHGYQKQIICNQDFWRLIGFWLAEGSLGNNKNPTYKRGVLELSQKNINVLNKYSKLIEKILKTKTNNYQYPNMNHTHVWDKPFCDWLSKNFLDKNDDKTIPWFIGQLNKDYFSAFMEGYLEGDGWIEFRTGRRGFSTSDEGLAGRMFAILNYLKILVSINHYRPKRGKEVFRFRFYKKNPRLYLSKKKVYSDGKDMVYDFQVEGAESYCTPTIILHNSKLKNLKSIDVLVLGIVQKKTKEGRVLPNYMYKSYYEIPASRVSEFYEPDIEKRDNKYYAYIGMSYATAEKANIGDIITIMPIRFRKYLKNDKIRNTWMFPYFKEIKKEKKEPDTLTTVERLIEVGTSPTLSEEDIKIEFELCPYYNKDICPLRKRYEKPYLSKDVLVQYLKYPVKCPLAYYYRCRYIKDYYYDIKKIGELCIEDGDTILNELDLPVYWRRIALQKYMECPPGEHEFVMQSHVIGKSQHLDWRMKVNNYLIGWSGVGGNIENPITPELLIKRSREEVGPKGVRTEEKARQPLNWLKFEGEIKPGEVGGGIEAPGSMTILTRGKVIYGAMKPYYHEYFVKDNKYFKDWTRIVIRAIRLKKLKPETKEPTKHYERMWRMLVADPLPYTISSRAIKDGWKPPRREKE
uniref:Putative DNA ligase domain protein n=1 Tax=viral metagenome TaxID=1070528 RepID=A0A6M3XHV5_9ZZZZ